MPHPALVPLMLPLLVAQAVGVRRRALILPEPPGPRAGTAGPPEAASETHPDAQPLRLLIAGDSSAAGVGTDHQSEALSGQLVTRLAPHYRLHWRLVARTGATTRDTLRRLADEPAGTAFDVAVTALGVNDVTGGVPRWLWLDRQRRLFDLLQGRFGVRRLVVSGVPPMGAFPLLPQPLRDVLGARATRLDAALRDLVAGREGVRHVPLAFGLTDRDLIARDGYHPGPRACALWAGLLVEAILAPGDG